MSRRPRCFYCGIGMSRKHRIPDPATRLLFMIVGRIVCRRCAAALLEAAS